MQQQQLTWASAGKPQVFESKRLPHLTPASPGNTSDRLHLFARSALVINWTGGADHVLTVFWIQVWFVVFMIRWNLDDPYRGGGPLQQEEMQHHLWYCKASFPNEDIWLQFTSPAQTQRIKAEYVWWEDTQENIKLKKESKSPGEGITAQAEKYLVRLQRTNMYHWRKNWSWMSCSVLAM